MSRYVLSAEAQIDLLEIKDYIANDSKEAARRVIAEFRKAFRELTRSSGIGHARKDLTKEPVLFWRLYSYLIIYRPATRPLEVLAVLHGKRNVKRILRERLREE